MQLTVDRIIHETDDAISVIFKKIGFFQNLSYKPGQFLTVKIPIENKIENRAYSLSSNPYKDKQLRITVKKVEKGLVSNYLCEKLQKGDKIEVDKPRGSFFVVPDKNNAFQYVLFAGGSGITPIYAIINSVLEKEPRSKLLLIYANRNKKSIIFGTDLESLVRQYPDRLAIENILETLSQPATNYHQDLLNQELIDKIMTKHQLSYASAKYYMCGPTGFMDKAKEILASHHITRDQIRLEAFSANPIRSSNSKDIYSQVTIVHNGDTHQIEVQGDSSILQAAMAKNIMLPYSCRSGMCSSCKASCVSGSVKMIDGHLLSDEEVAKGNILTCISYPVSESVEITI